MTEKTPDIYDIAQHQVDARYAEASAADNEKIATRRMELALAEASYKADPSAENDLDRRVAELLLGNAEALSDADEIRNIGTSLIRGQRTLDSIDQKLLAAGYNSEGRPNRLPRRGFLAWLTSQ